MKRIWIPILLVGLITPFTPALDLELAHYFYATHPIYDWVYRWAVYPAFVVAFGALFFWIFSSVTPYFKKWRASCAVLVLSLALGAGLIVHTLLKDRWGRPRPRQIEEFGGHMKFRPYYLPNFSQTEPAKSFPCGHCTMGFYFFALAVVFQRQNWRWAALGAYGIAIGLGILLGVTRMAQGGHFFSDVLISALIMWLVACLLDRYFSRKIWS